MNIHDVKDQLDKTHVTYQVVGPILRIRETKSGPYMLVTIADHIPGVYFKHQRKFVFVRFALEEKEHYYDSVAKACEVISGYITTYYLQEDDGPPVLDNICVSCHMKITECYGCEHCNTGPYCEGCYAKHNALMEHKND